MDALATVEDYATRYGEPADRGRAAALLGDASALILSAYESHHGEPYAAGAHPAFDRAAAAVCCLLVNRVLATPAPYTGATQMSQGAGTYTASISFGNGLGEMYLGKADMARLGLDGQAIRFLHPIGEGS